MAIEIEHRLNEKRKLKAIHSVNHSAHSERSLITGAVERSPPNYDTSAAIESLTEDSSQTIRGASINETTESSFMKNFAEMNIDGIAPLTLNIDMISNDNPCDYLSPSFSLHSSPSLGALNDSNNKSLYFTPMSGRETLSPISHGEFKPVPLIRSNSYTLEKPSPMLLQHMEANGMSTEASSPFRTSRMLNKQSLQLNLTSSTPRKQIKTSTTTDTKSKTKVAPTKTLLVARKSFSPVRNTSASKGSASKRKSAQAGSFKNTASVLRSIYAPAIPTNKKPESIKKSESIKKPNGTTSLNTSARNKTKTPTNLSSSTQQAVVETNPNLLNLIETQFTAQMEALIQQQKEEQLRMQEKFRIQQEEILKQIHETVIRKNKSGLSDTVNQTTANLSKTSEQQTPIDTNGNIGLDSNGNRVNRFTPDSGKCIRRLYYDDHKLVSADLMSTHPMNSPTKPTMDEIKAATTIVAYARGYLTRRLFKTHDVQDIVKTIRDTLLLILDIHFEDDANEQPADIEFKTHLIQQVKRAKRINSFFFFFFLSAFESKTTFDF